MVIATPSNGTPHIVIKNEIRLDQIDSCLRKLYELFRDSFLDTEESRNSGRKSLFHYTLFSKLFDILEGDAFWASRSRFSNDSTEDMLFDCKWLEKKQYYGDNYIVCFSTGGDLLSQWRGYCPQGGASIEFDILDSHTYTLFHEDVDSKAMPNGDDVASYKNVPFPVLYSQPEFKNDEDETAICRGPIIVDLRKRLEEYIVSKINDPSNVLSEIDIIPFLKNGYFFEEMEHRLVFDNTDGSLEKCIRFRKEADGSRVPYIVVKYGYILESNRDLRLTFTDERITEIFEAKKSGLDNKAIVIPCGINQEVVCRDFSQKILQYKKEIYAADDETNKHIWEQSPIRIICDGHLPVRSITVSPSPQQEYMKEVIERFCRSRYWLQNVEVKCSPIPYIAPRI